MNYISVAQTTVLGEGKKIKVTYNGKDILLTNIQDIYYAIDNTCPHMGGSLYDGDLDGSHIVCPKHGSIFDVKTGKVIRSGKLFLFMPRCITCTATPLKLKEPIY